MHVVRPPMLGAALATLLALAPESSIADGASAQLYGPEPPVVPSPVEARVLDVVRSRLGAGERRPRISGALVLAAREIAARGASGAPDPITPARIRGALARALGPDPAVAAVMVAAAPWEAAGAVARSLPRKSATHLGAGAVERDGKEWVVLLLSDRKVKLEPFPRDFAPGTRAVLSGSLTPPLSGGRVYVTDPSGEAIEAGGSSGPTFHVPIAFPARGRYVVEVVAEGSGGPEVAAVLTVSAGGASLDPPPTPTRRRDPGDRAAAERAVLDAINATRSRHKLPPLALDPEMVQIARRHSEAMAAAGEVAHRVPGSGDAGARLRRAGVAYRAVFENVARGATALDAHLDMMEESPAHLLNVLRREATQIGIGMARARLASGDGTAYLTEIMIEPPDDGTASPLTPDARVREALWQERARLRLPPLTSDLALDAIAREAATAMRSHDATDADGLGDRALELRRKIAAVDVYVASAPADAIHSANLRDRRFSRVGVGIASGDSRRFGKARLWIVVVYTD